MIHLYHGDGKGKTTAAMGLALRMAGRNRCVVIAQFLKGSDSGERAALSLIPQVTLLEIPQSIKFSFQLSSQERLEEQARYQALLEQLGTCCSPSTGLVVLDEVCDAVNAGLLPLEDLLSFLQTTRAEVVLTGRNPASQLVDLADYITCFEKQRHPFDKGCPARSGVEF